MSAFELENLTYAFPDGSIGLQDLKLDIPLNSRTLLIGANGAGKSTLLRILAGKTLAKAGSVKVLGMDPFRTGLIGVTYLGTEWASNAIVRRDMPVPTLLNSVGGEAFQDRLAELIDILDIDLRWHMHAVSDGERRRVQLAMGLVRPWNILLLDEVTVDLDVLVRARLLNFLRRETESRDCAIMYATHIFDGLADWPTHIVHIHMGRIINFGKTAEIIASETAEDNSNSLDVSIRQGNSILLTIALKWLSNDLADRGRREDMYRDAY
ncbi:P-loop containing nucleoside triphosphate hydrolase protein [Dipodascopsis uninucleata]